MSSLKDLVSKGVRLIVSETPGSSAEATSNAEPHERRHPRRGVRGGSPQPVVQSQVPADVRTSAPSTRRPASTLPPHGYGVDKVAEMLDRQAPRPLSREVRATAVMAALEAAQVDVQDVIADGVRRDRALDAFEAAKERELAELREENEARVRALRQEMDALLAKINAEIEKLKQASETPETPSRSCRCASGRRRQRLHDVVAHFVEGPKTPSPPVPCKAPRQAKPPRGDSRSYRRSWRRTHPRRRRARRIREENNGASTDTPGPHPVRRVPACPWSATPSTGTASSGRLANGGAGEARRGHGLQGRLRGAPAPLAPRRPAPPPTSRPVPAARASTRPIRVAIVLWGGYAGGIMANGGMTPNPRQRVHARTSASRSSCCRSTTSRSRATPSAPAATRVASTSCGRRSTRTPSSTAGSAKLDPKAIMQYDWSRGGDAIAVDKSIQTPWRTSRASGWPARRRRRRITSRLYVLTQGGLTNRDVNWVFTASAVDAANVFKAGKVDAAVSWSPDVYVAAREREGGHILGLHQGSEQPHRGHLRGPRRLPQKHPEDARRFVAGWLKGVEMVQEEPGEGGRPAAEEPHRRQHPGRRARPCWTTSSSRLRREPRLLRPQGAPSSTTTRSTRRAQNIWRKIGKISSVERGRSRRWTRASWRRRPSSSRTRAATAKPGRVRLQAPRRSASAHVHPDQDGVHLLPRRARRCSTRTPRPCSRRRWWTWPPPSAAPTCASPATPTTWAAATRTSGCPRRAPTRWPSSWCRRASTPNKFDVVGNGPDKPVAGNDTDAGRAKNRRTDFEVMPALMEVRGRSQPRPAAASWRCAGGGDVRGPVVRASATPGWCRPSSCPRRRRCCARSRSSTSRRRWCAARSRSFYRVNMGFLLAAVVAIPLGICDGDLPAAQALLHPHAGSPALPAHLGAGAAVHRVVRHRRACRRSSFLFVGTSCTCCRWWWRRWRTWRRSTCRRRPRWAPPRAS